ncbi:phosphotransferase enzyme family protein [Paenibacillus medicaginis]|uniref:Phosphotransferase enzyme family protein n=1 Tax=Paenibacillus medicaginis TaxID=1470560 RepID=A0ABV5BY58_9BACL
MTEDTKESLAAEIAAHLKHTFGLSVSEAAVIDKGWLNIKWKMVTDQGPRFIKYYHPVRYNLNARPEKRNAIENTLRIQHVLNRAGVPCPQVFPHNSHCIQETPSGLLYTMLEWTDGYTAEAGSLNTIQMYQLGQAAGKMHKWLRSVPPLNKPAWKPDKDLYLKEWQVNHEKAQAAGDEIVLEWLNRSRQVVKAMDFRMFESSPAGWLHWDLWVDNILLNPEGLASIVDFDRMTMVYQEIDIARAILSGSLRNGQLNKEAAQAFLNGYREHLEVPYGMLSRAMYMLYLDESIWWLRTEVRMESEIRSLLHRFVEEMHWIEDHWTTLPDQLESLL